MRLIDADEAVRAVHDEFDECLVWDESGATTANEFENIILQVPTVDMDAIAESHERIGYDRGFSDGYAQATSEVRHGHWTDNGHIGKRRWCSVCGGIAFEQYDDYGLAEVTESDYCPHCGAKMDEVEDGLEGK